MKKMNKVLALLLAASLVLSVGVQGAMADGAKWAEQETADGWMLVTNEGGKTLGYSKDSGVALIEDDGFAFKDLNKNGKLDPYEDWRLDYETRAWDLVNQMSGEQIAPYLTHGGWGTFTTDKKTFLSEENSGYQYILAGGRGGVTRNAGSDVEGNVAHAKWSNMMQELCESLDFGIPGVISIDPNGQSDIMDRLGMTATFDPDMAFEIGKEYSKQYRAMGISMLLGPQVDLTTSPVMDRGNGTYTEDPALNRDIAEAFVSGLQSTFDADGNDLGWGSDSVIAIMKHYAGAGAGEGGRDDHSATGAYDVFPNNNFEAHLIAIHDGAFNLQRSSTGKAGGIMTNYAISYSEDGSLGELVGGAFSQYKYDVLFSSGWTGYIISDWGPLSGGGGSWGMQDYTNAERVAITIQLGMNAMGGFGEMDDMQEAYEILVDELGEDEALSLMRTRAYEVALISMETGLFENPYCSTEYVRQTNCTEASKAFGMETQLASIVMLKNDGTIKAAEGGEKLTVYIPYTYTPFQKAAYASSGDTLASWDPCMDLELVGQYFNVVTDTVAEPTGEDGGLTENDIIRASAEELAKCDIMLVAMNAPHVRSTAVTNDDGSTTYLPPSIQYGEYKATTAKEKSVAGDLITTTFSDGYTMQTVVVPENRSYRGQTAAKASNYSDLEMLQLAKENAGDAKVVVLMRQTQTGAMVWSEVEPLADVILNGYSGVTDEAFLKVVSGEYEPNGLLVMQMPASMKAVEAQADDLPRDCEVYVDAAGNAYDFAYGMNWSGVINDERVATYNVEPLTKCTSFEFHYASYFEH